MPQAPAPDKYETQLSPTEERQFQTWKAQYAPKDSGYDYDLRGAYKAGLKPDPKTGHWPDTFKKPNHPTFSVESKYAKDRPDLAGHWEGEKYIPPARNKMADGLDNAPLNNRQAPPGPQPAPPGPAAAPQQNAPAPPQQNPQQADMAHHALLGKAVSALMGNTVNYQIDPATGKTIAVPQKNTPGQFGRSMVLGALLGLSAASSGKAEGGSTGGFLGGLGRGGTAVAEHGEQQDAQRRQQAQQQYQQQLAAEQNQREQVKFAREGEAFKTEQEHKRAIIASENAQTLRTQQLMKGESWQQYEREAEYGKAKVQPYIDSGIQPIQRDATQEDIQKVVAANPKASAWDWEQTGVKAVQIPDGKGGTTTSYVPTFDAFDPDKSVKVTAGFLKLLKDAKIDDYYPQTTDRLKEGQELKPAEFVALKNQYQQVHNMQMEQQKGQLTLEEMKEREKLIDAERHKYEEEAKRQGKGQKNAQLLSDALDKWTDKYNELAKTNPNATHLDAFKALSPKQQFEITANLTKMMSTLDAEIKTALNAIPPDQETANRLKAQEDVYRQMAASVTGVSSASASSLPKAPAPGTQAPPNLIKQALDASGGDPAKANQMLIDQGYADTLKPSAAASPAPGGSQSQPATNARQENFGLR